MTTPMIDVDDFWFAALLSSQAMSGGDSRMAQSLACATCRPSRVEEHTAGGVAALAGENATCHRQGNDACFVIPGKQQIGEVQLFKEVFTIPPSAALCLWHWPTRMRDVRLGIVPLVKRSAFPRGLTILFPNWVDCLNGDPPTGRDRA